MANGQRQYGDQLNESPRFSIAVITAGSCCGHNHRERLAEGSMLLQVHISVQT